MKKERIAVATLFLLLLVFVSSALSFKLPGFGGPSKLVPAEGFLAIPLEDIDDGKAHHFKVKSADGVEVTFFVLKSRDGVIRAAIDACDVCYRSGKGYTQKADHMVCENCGQRFASEKINEIKGGCNPAPLKRKIEGKNLIIAMADINTNSWYCEFKK